MFIHLEVIVTTTSTAEIPVVEISSNAFSLLTCSWFIFKYVCVPEAHVTAGLLTLNLCVICLPPFPEKKKGAK